MNKCLIKHLMAGVANQMMKGPVQGRYAKNSTAESRKAFLAQHSTLIEEVLTKLPRYSVAVPAVVCKCAIKYGKEKAFCMADTMRNGTFNGPEDPCLHLVNYLKRTKDSTISIYKKTLYAAIAYCEDRKIKSVKPSRYDIDVLPNETSAIECLDERKNNQPRASE